MLPEREVGLSCRGSQREAWLGTEREREKGRERGRERERERKRERKKEREREREREREMIETSVAVG